MAMLETIRPSWADFMQVATLCRRAGCSAQDLVLVAAKELLDNAHDSAPQSVAATLAGRMLVVSDRGLGMPEDLITRVFDLRRESLSSKRWRLARRGVLGNGSRVALAVASMSGVSLTVESRGRGMELAVGSDGSTRVQRAFTSEIEEGTRISLSVGPNLHFDPATIQRLIELCQAGAGSAFGGSKAVPSWFDGPAIRELVRDAPAGTSALAFARAFDLTDVALSRIKSAASRTTTADLLQDEHLLSVVTQIIMSGGKDARDLKRMGRGARPGAYAFEEATFRLGGVALPCIVEAWVTASPTASRKANGVVKVGALFANRTPAIQRAAEGYVSAETKDLVVYLGAEYGVRIPAGLKAPCNFSIDIAVVAGELPLVSDGKALDLSAFRGPIGKAIAAAARRAYVPPAGKVAVPSVATTAMKPRDAIYAVLECAYCAIADAGLGVPARMLYYKIRPEVLRLTGAEELSYKKYNETVLDFMEDHPDKCSGWEIQYDVRGSFIEPGGVSIGLGTANVNRLIEAMGTDLARFTPEIGDLRIEHVAKPLIPGNNPAHRYSAVVFIEKEGYRELIRKSKIAERFDVAFASTKGVPTTAIRILLDKLAEFDIPVLVLHDMDETGFKILNTLRSSNARYSFRNKVRVVDMGIRLADAEALGGLQSERFKIGENINKPALKDRLQGYGATEAEVEMLVDRQLRIEIDALSPEQLVAFIEAKLAGVGVRKIVPAEEAMRAHYVKAVTDARIARALKPLQAQFTKRLTAFRKKLEKSGDLDIEVPIMSDAIRRHYAAHPEATLAEAVAAVARQHDGEPAS